MTLNMDVLIKYGLRSGGRLSFSLKHEQKACVERVLKGKDVFYGFSTGFGKSLCYKILPFVFNKKLGKEDSVVIVVSPLVSLMSDQVYSLRQRHVKAAIISSARELTQMKILPVVVIYFVHQKLCSPPCGELILRAHLYLDELLQLSVVSRLMKHTRSTSKFCFNQRNVHK